MGFCFFQQLHLQNRNPCACENRTTKPWFCAVMMKAGSHDNEANGVHDALLNFEGEGKVVTNVLYGRKIRLFLTRNLLKQNAKQSLEINVYKHQLQTLHLKKNEVEGIKLVCVGKKGYYN